LEKKINAVVLKAINFGENDKILTLFSLEEGIVLAKIKGVKKAGAKLKFASEPFCFAEYTISYSGDKNTVTGAYLYDGFYSIREDVIAYYIGACVLEFTKIFSLNDKNVELFESVVNALKSICYEDKNKYFSLIKFFVSGLKSVGYALNLLGCSGCKKEIENRAFFNEQTGAFLCFDCANSEVIEVSINTYKILAKASEEKGVTLSEIEQKELLNNEFYLKRVLKFLAFYIDDKTSEKLKSLTDLLNL
jgi:DNA repair protein RecO (recombination protein O)